MNEAEQAIADYRAAYEAAGDGLPVIATNRDDGFLTFLQGGTHE